MSTARSGRRGRAGRRLAVGAGRHAAAAAAFEQPRVQTWRALIVEVYLELTEDTMVNAINVVD
jgi:hypothetical protein